MVGRAISKMTEAQLHLKLATAERRDLDLSDQDAVKVFSSAKKVDEVYLCAARVDSVVANSIYPASIISGNLAVPSPVICAAHECGAEKVLFLGNCIYPNHAVQPITEESRLTGPLKETNKPYAIAKIAVLKMCEAFKAA